MWDSSRDSRLISLGIFSPLFSSFCFFSSSWSSTRVKHQTRRLQWKHFVSSRWRINMLMATRGFVFFHDKTFKSVCDLFSFTLIENFHEIFIDFKRHIGKEIKVTFLQVTQWCKTKLRLLFFLVYFSKIKFELWKPSPSCQLDSHYSPVE